MISSSQAPPARFYGNGDATLSGTVAFPSVTNLDSRLGASGVAIADFTGDGVPDIVAANGGNLQCAPAAPCFGGQTARLFAGIGGGRFAPPVDLPSQPGSRVITGDWNGDLLPDLAFTGAGPQSPQLYILLGIGDGTFAANGTYNFPGPRLNGLDAFIVSARIDAGDSPDLLTASIGTGEVSVFTGDGDGGFTPRPTILFGVQIECIAPGDFDKDGRADLAVAFKGTLGNLDGKLMVARGNGDGTFQTPVPLRENVSANWVATGDFDGDGALDLAAALEITRFNWDIEILLGNGDMTFGAPMPLGTDDGQVGGVCVVDADRDGILDLGVRAGSTTLIGYRGLGDGTFNRALLGSAGGGAEMHTDDLDLDGKPDLVTATRSGFFSVQLNTLAQFGIGSPFIRISQSGGSIKVAWPLAFREFGIAESQTLTGWKKSERAVEEAADIFQFFVDPADGPWFFRLERP
ncbi:MAG: VCBS repeat-containing protein [Verrucomicrobiales bacterium]